MKYRDPQPTVCSECDRRFSVSVAALRSLRAVCPGCGATLAAIGESMLQEEARIGRQIDLIIVSLALDEQNGWAITDSADRSEELSLDGLIHSVAALLHPAADREARATELVTEVARRVAPRLLSEAGLA